MDLQKRKPTRLQGYDYSQNGAYFLTLCTQDRRCILCDIVGDGFHPVPQTILSPIGQEIENSIAYMNHRYDDIVEKYVIMPNHIHMVVLLTGGHTRTGHFGNPTGGHTRTGHFGNPTGGHGNPPLQDVVGRIKSFTTKRYNEILHTENRTLWQRSYYDHIIRNEEDYRQIWQYIDDNPRKWQEDELHP